MLKAKLYFNHTKNEITFNTRCKRNEITFDKGCKQNYF